MRVIYISTYSKLKCYINIACIRGLKYKTLEIATITDRKHRVTLFNYNTLCRQYMLTHTACEMNALYAFTRSGFSRLPLISLPTLRSTAHNQCWNAIRFFAVDIFGVSYDVKQYRERCQILSHFMAWFKCFSVWYGNVSNVSANQNHLF